MKWGRIFAGALCLALLGLGGTFASSESTSVRIASTEKALSHVIAREILKEAYAEAGIQVEFVNMPWLRSLSRSNAGFLDGETARMQVIEKEYRNLVRIPTKLYDLDSYAYALKPIPHIKSWQDLKPLRIGLELGVVVSATATKGMNQQFAASTVDLVLMLKRGGTDVMIYVGLEDFREPPFKLHRSPKLQSDSLFHYVHRSQAHLVQPLSDALTKLHETGRIEALVAKHKNAS